MISLGIKAALALFGGAGIWTKVIVVGALALTLVAGYGVWHFHVWSNGRSYGYDEALKDIAKQDGKAIAKANSYRAAVRDCRAGGLRWDQSTGQCKGR